MNSKPRFTADDKLNLGNGGGGDVALTAELQGSGRGLTTTAPLSKSSSSAFSHIDARRFPYSHAPGGPGLHPRPSLPVGDAAVRIGTNGTGLAVEESLSQQYGANGDEQR